MQRIPFDALGEFPAQTNNSYTVAFILYMIHVTISSFPTARYFMYWITAYPVKRAVDQDYNWNCMHAIVGGTMNEYKKKVLKMKG